MFGRLKEVMSGRFREQYNDRMADLNQKRADLTPGSPVMRIVEAYILEPLKISDILARSPDEESTEYLLFHKYFFQGLDTIEMDSLTKIRDDIAQNKVKPLNAYSGLKNKLIELIDAQLHLLRQQASVSRP